MGWFVGLVAACLTQVALPARAALVSYGFQCISTGVASACATGKSQFVLDVSEGATAPSGNSSALFVFRNVGLQMSSITDVYFDDGTLLAIAAVQNGDGVDFSQDASPSNLPGGNSLSVPFQATAGFSADSNPPTQANGANPGEQVGVLFELVEGKTFSDLILALNGGTRDDKGAPAVRVGLHAQGFSDGESAAFVNTTAPVSVVPLPASAGLLFAGLLMMLRRRAAFTPNWLPMR